MDVWNEQVVGDVHARMKVIVLSGCMNLTSSSCRHGFINCHLFLPDEKTATHISKQVDELGPTKGK